MLALAKMLIIFSIAFLINGCADKQPCVDQIVNVPVKCIIPSREIPELEKQQFSKGQELEQVKQLYRNFLKMKEFSELLQGDIQICQ